MPVLTYFVDELKKGKRTIAIETSIDRYLIYFRFILVSALQQDYAYNHRQFQMQAYFLPIRT